MFPILIFLIVIVVMLYTKRLCSGGYLYTGPRHTLFVPNNQEPLHGKTTAVSVNKYIKDELTDKFYDTANNASNIDNQGISLMYPYLIRANMIAVEKISQNYAYILTVKGGGILALYLTFLRTQFYDPNLLNHSLTQIKPSDLDFDVTIQSRGPTPAATPAAAVAAAPTPPAGQIAEIKVHHELYDKLFQVNNEIAKNLNTILGKDALKQWYKTSLNDIETNELLGSNKPVIREKLIKYIKRARKNEIDEYGGQRDKVYHMKKFLGITDKDLEVKITEEDPLKSKSRESSQFSKREQMQLDSEYLQDTGLAQYSASLSSPNMKLINKDKSLGGEFDIDEEGDEMTGEELERFVQEYRNFIDTCSYQPSSRSCKWVLKEGVPNNMLKLNSKGKFDEYISGVDNKQLFMNKAVYPVINLMGGLQMIFPLSRISLSVQYECENGCLDKIYPICLFDYGYTNSSVSPQNHIDISGYMKEYSALGITATNLISDDSILNNRLNYPTGGKVYTYSLLYYILGDLRKMVLCQSMFLPGEPKWQKRLFRFILYSYLYEIYGEIRPWDGITPEPVNPFQFSPKVGLGTAFIRQLEELADNVREIWLGRIENVPTTVSSDRIRELYFLVFKNMKIAKLMSSKQKSISTEEFKNLINYPSMVDHTECLENLSSATEIKLTKYTRDEIELGKKQITELIVNTIKELRDLHNYIPAAATPAAAAAAMPAAAAAATPAAAAAAMPAPTSIVPQSPWGQLLGAFHSRYIVN